MRLVIIALSILAAGPAAFAATLSLASSTAPESPRVVRSAGQWHWQRGTTTQVLPLSTQVAIESLAGDQRSAVIAGVESVGGRDRIHVVEVENDRPQALAAPQTTGATILQPTALVGPNGLESLIWIEGADSQSGAVKSAFFRDGAWSEPTTVAPSGQGTQIALRAQRLRDGSYLAVWAAFDGEDDEIVWSRFTGSWSPVRALSANKVPDITPDLLATADGALVVWSFYDGNDYRLGASHFTNNVWSERRTFGGKGAVMPRLQASAGGAVAVARQALPRQWVAFELDAQARLGRSAATPVERLEHPLPTADALGVRLEWPAAGQEALVRSLTWQTP
jgi:hypothetical protein